MTPSPGIHNFWLQLQPSKIAWVQAPHPWF